MTQVRINLMDPSTGDYLDGQVTFTYQHRIPGRASVQGASVVSGRPVRVEVSGEDTTVELHPTPAGAWYRVVGSDEAGYRFTEHVMVTGTADAADYGDLPRVDPLAGGLTYTPDPEWWQIADEMLALGGIPGKSAKEVLEAAEGASMTLAEFEARIRGAKGDPGEDGRDGYTALDFFRQQVDNPQASEAEMWEWLRGRTALEQWAVYVGRDVDDVEVADMLEWLRVDAFKLWKEDQGRPDASLDDFFAYFKGEKGDASTVPGPRGERGKSAYESVVDSGFEGSEEDFAGSLLGEIPEWVEVSLINGWTSADGKGFRYREIDGMVEVRVSLNRSANDHWRVISLSAIPERLLPAETVTLTGTRGNSSTVRFELSSGGNFFLSSAHQGAAGDLLILRDSYPVPGAVSRSRIPGPAGKSAVELLQEDGLDLSTEEITRRLRVLVEGVE